MVHQSENYSPSLNHILIIPQVGIVFPFVQFDFGDTVLYRVVHYLVLNLLYSPLLKKDIIMGVGLEQKFLYISSKISLEKGLIDPHVLQFC